MDEELPYFYALLGVARDATAEQIKKAWRIKARQYHPDYNKEPYAEAHFKQVQEAYAVLSDVAQRAEYDARGPQFNREDREILSNAEGLLTENVLAWASDPKNDHNTADLLAHLESLFYTLETNATAAVFEGEKVAARLARQINKLKYKGKRDFLTIALQSRREAVLGQKSNHEKLLKIVEVSRAILKDYDFECMRSLPYGSIGRVSSTQGYPHVFTIPGT